MADRIRHPSHYCRPGGIECIEAIKGGMSREGYRGYLRGNIIKYVWRYDRKNGLEDLEKARTYLEWLIEETEEKEVLGR